MKPTVLLFDIGNVLVDFTGPEGLCAMLKGRYSLAEVWKMWPQSPALRKFEVGHIGEEQFVSEFISEWELDISELDFLQEFSSWARAPLDGAVSLLDELRDVATLACLTNMNATYWKRIRDDMGFGRRFDRCYASHETGWLKPNAEAYQHVISDLSCEPAGIVFFDDTWNNVTAAEALGIRAFQTHGVEDLRTCITACLHDAPRENRFSERTY